MSVLKKTNSNFTSQQPKDSYQGNTISDEIIHEMAGPLGSGITLTSSLLFEFEKMRTIIEKGGLTKSQMANFFNESKTSSEVLLRCLFKISSLLELVKCGSGDVFDSTGDLVPLEAALSETIKNITPIIPPGIEVRLTTDIGLDAPRVPEHYIDVILTNLVNNSLRHGYTDGRTGPIDIKAEWDLKGFRIIYRDEGHGMDKDTLSHIFKPYFTTKKEIGGSGIGLSLVYRCVTVVLGGRIHCSSTLNEFAEFDIFIPNEKATL